MTSNDAMPSQHSPPPQRPIGATLPDTFTRQVAHLSALVAEQRTIAPPPAQIAQTLVQQYLGEPGEMRKARKQAAAALSAADADARITPALIDRAGSVLFVRMVADRELLAAAFGRALAGPLDILAAEAGRLPAHFDESQADGLSADLFGAWTRARAALGVIESTQRALDPLYKVPKNDVVTIEAQASLRWLLPPQLYDADAAHSFVSAAAGHRASGAEGLGPHAVLRQFTATAALRLGGVVEWAGPAEHARRVQHIIDASARPVVERGDRRRVVRV